MRHCPILAALLATAATIAASVPAPEGNATATTGTAPVEPFSADGWRFLWQSLGTDIYTADPSAHV